ncbi:hypothetical protein [Borrelia sp. RT5S]|uniref:hypothetical protein n=1 Tax=Borrelia sp. RT5S TaxID=2898581 RepID=UPI001E4E0976|nr:hypothetical protein [Borrelia sp. RT5S]UGQ16795.1 hypothetical protein LSO06_05590 [Borrelia sp. RT5S]
MRFVSIIFPILLCVSSLSYLSAGVSESCGEHLCSRTYEMRVNHAGKIKSILFQKEVLSKEGEGYQDYEESYRELLGKSFPSYRLEFRILGEKRMLNFKNVIFGGLDAQMSMFDMTERSAQLAGIKDFHIAPVENNKELLDLVFPVEVKNTLVVYLKQEFVEKLKQKDKLKFTLVAHDDTEYDVELPNFLKEHDF